MRQLDSTILIEEARLGDYKRQTTKDWMALKFGGLSELAEKMMVRSSLPIPFKPLLTSFPYSSVDSRQRRKTTHRGDSS